jgi:hypothetical protein
MRALPGLQRIIIFSYIPFIRAEGPPDPRLSAFYFFLKISLCGPSRTIFSLLKVLVKGPSYYIFLIIEGPRSIFS